MKKVLPLMFLLMVSSECADHNHVSIQHGIRHSGQCGDRQSRSNSILD